MVEKIIEERMKKWRECYVIKCEVVTLSKNKVQGNYNTKEISKIREKKWWSSHVTKIYIIILNKYIGKGK